ncbi:hypothetical protein [Streptomyces sp. NPDC057838]|uniref:hypothetical protein n=1 Tax=unclassified Streptomyces TaxID=2593676 RepID=UPI0036BB1060
MRFIRAFAEVVQRIDGHTVDWATWTDGDTIEFLRWLEFVPEDAWTGLDDVEFVSLAGGAS